MNVEWTPMRWPAAWTDPASLSLLRGTAINYLLIDAAAALDSVRSEARKGGCRSPTLPRCPPGFR